MKLFETIYVLTISLCLNTLSTLARATPNEFRVLEVAGDVRLDNQPALFNAAILPTTKVDLAPTAQLVAYSTALKLRIVGPNSGLFETFTGNGDPPSSMLSRLMFALQGAAAILSTRGDATTAPQDIWTALVDTNGNKCAPNDGNLSVTLPKEAHDSYLSVRAIASGAPEIIPTGSRTQVKWPKAIPFVDGAEYELELESKRPVRWKVYRMPEEPSPTNESTELFLAEHTCLEQLVAFARALPDDKIIPPATK
jgi:hypothetical protein